MKPTRKIRALFVLLVTTAAAAVLSGPASAASLTGDALVEALQKGGYVIVMRHASATGQTSGPQGRGSGGAGGERQLDEHGRGTMTAMRSAFRRMGIPVGDVHSSPTLRARQTAEQLGFGTRHVDEQLGGEQGDAGWLRAKAAEAPPEGRNTVIITHARNLTEAFGDDASNMRDGEALIFRAEDGRAELAARVQVEEWALLGRGAAVE